MKSSNLFFSFFLLIAVTSCNNKQKVSLIIHHAKIYTADETFSEAEAMAVTDGKIIATGTNEIIQKTYTASENIDAKGNTIFPGFIDAHCHFTGYATDMWKCNLVGTTSFDEVVNKIKEDSIKALHQAQNKPVNKIPFIRAAFYTNIL